MKNTILLFSAILCSVAVFSQDIHEAERMIDYERYATAENILHKVINTDKQNSNAWYLLGNTYLQQDKLAALKDTLAKADPGVTGSPLLTVLQGAILLKENKYGEATQNFQSGLDKTKYKDADVLEAVARAYMSVKNTDKNYPVKILETAVSRKKKNPRLWILLGDAYSNTGDGTNAYKCYMNALNIDPAYAAAKYKIGGIYFTQKNPNVYIPYYEEALSLDSLYAPAYYSLYYYYYATDVNKAMDYLQGFIAHSDYNIDNDYALTDQFYVSRRYGEAISKATDLIAKEGDSVKPRVYKLIAYSYVAKKDYDKAQPFIKKYFANEVDSNYVPKDYALAGEISANTDSLQTDAIGYYEKAFAMEKDSLNRLSYAKQLIALNKEAKQFDQQEKWSDFYYRNNPRATNLDLFNWGVANYQVKNYVKADSVFQVFTVKYPDERFGYYWRAKSNAAIDSTMEKGLAIPHFQKVIEIASEDTTNATNVMRLKEAYGYIATFEANVEKDYVASIDYFEKLLALDPDNKEIKRNIDILKNKTLKNN